MRSGDFEACSGGVRVEAGSVGVGGGRGRSRVQRRRDSHQPPFYPSSPVEERIQSDFSLTFL